jgi:hypothetical protein
MSGLPFSLTQSIYDQRPLTEISGFFIMNWTVIEAVCGSDLPLVYYFPKPSRVVGETLTVWFRWM